MKRPCESCNTVLRADHFLVYSEPVATCAFAQEQPNTLTFASGARVIILSLTSLGRKTRWRPLLSIELSL